MTMINTPEGIAYVQLAAVKGAIRLESLGMRRSGGNIRKGWAIRLGLKPNAKHAVVIEEIERRMKEMRPD